MPGGRRPRTHARRYGVSVRMPGRRSALAGERPDGRRVVAVTGAAGRVGSACLRALADEPVDVVAIDLVAGDGPGYWRRADLRRWPEAVTALAGVTDLIHLAGHTAPGGQRTSTVLLDNVEITANVLEAFASGPSGASGTAVLASSVSVYGMVWSPSFRSPDYVPVDEDHPCRPSDPYSSSKLVAEMLAGMWTRSAGITTVTLRFPWTSGDEPDRLRAFLDVVAQDPTGEVGCRNMWAHVHVDDVASAMVAALDVHDGRAHVLNIASTEVPGGRLASELMATCHPQSDVRGSVDVTGLFATDRARELLGWTPTRSLLAGRDSRGPEAPGG